MSQQDTFYEALCRTAGFALVAADRDLRIRSWNDRAALLFSRSAGALLGHPLTEAFPEALRPQIEVLVREALDRGVSNDVEFTWTDASGIEKILVAIVSPIAPAEGEALGVSLAIRDITPRRQAVQAVRNTAARLKAIFENAAEGIVTADESGRIESFNPAAERIFGWRADEVIGKDLAILMPEPDRSKHAAYVRRYIDTGEKHIIGVGREVVGLRKNGETFPLDLAVSDVHLGRTRIFTGIMRDMTDRKKLASEVAESRRMASLGTMAEGVSHHFNNILGGVLTSIDAALSSDSPREYRKTLERAATSIGRASRITQQLLAFSQSEHTLGHAVDLTEAVRQFVDAFRPEVEKKGIAFDAMVEPIPPVSFESHRIIPILESLSQNAVDATKPGGRLSIRLRPDGDHAMIEIADTGSGISPENLERVFEPFFTTKGQLGGGQGANVGLGLSAVHGLLKELGGTIAVASILDRGTTMTVRLPLKPAARQHDSTQRFE